jgi:hypothetical protein
VLKQISSHQTKFEDHRVLFALPAGAEASFRVCVLYGHNGQPRMFAVQTPRWTDLHTADAVGVAREGVPTDWIDDAEDLPTVLALAALWKSIRDHGEAELAGLLPMEACGLADR